MKVIKISVRRVISRCAVHAMLARFPSSTFYLTGKKRNTGKILICLVTSAGYRYAIKFRTCIARNNGAVVILFGENIFRMLYEIMSRNNFLFSLQIFTLTKYARGEYNFFERERGGRIDNWISFDRCLKATILRLAIIRIRDDLCHPPRVWQWCHTYVNRT